MRGPVLRQKVGVSFRPAAFWLGVLLVHINVWMELFLNYSSKIYIKNWYSGHLRFQSSHQSIFVRVLEMPINFYLYLTGVIRYAFVIVWYEYSLLKVMKLLPEKSKLPILALPNASLKTAGGCLMAFILLLVACSVFFLRGCSTGRTLLLCLGNLALA